jgi:hypothetical protein
MERKCLEGEEWEGKKGKEGKGGTVDSICGLRNNNNTHNMPHAIIMLAHMLAHMPNK